MELLKGVDVFLTYEAKCYKFYQSSGLMSHIEIQQLCSDHEEADTRMVAHARYASQLFSTIIIQSPDTDVFLLHLMPVWKLMPICSSKREWVKGDVSFQ